MEKRGIISIISRAQGAVIDITHDEGSRTCSNSTQKITVLFLEPLIDGTVPFVEVRDGVYKSIAKVNDGSQYHVNPYNTLGSLFQTNGQMVKFIPRTIQVYKGSWL